MDQALLRLERVTERLERLEATRQQQASPVPAASSRAPGPIPAQQSAAPAAPQASTTRANTPATWPAFLATYLSPLVTASSGLGDEVLKAFQPFNQAFEAVSRVLYVASIAQKPSDAGGLQALLQPVSGHMAALGTLAEGRRTPAFNHVKAMSESVQGLAWLMYTGPSCGLSPPSQLVADSWQSAEFFATRVLKEFKDKDDAHVAWVKCLKELMTQLEAFVQERYPQGPIWAEQGAGMSLAQALTAPDPPATAAAPSSSAAAAPAPAPAPPPRAGAPPPPPGLPPPPLSVKQIQQGSGAKAPGPAAGGSGDMSALFKDIAKGEGLTAGLKKVTDDMKTKNRADRTSVVKMPETQPGGATAAAGPKGTGGGGPAAGARGGVPTGPAALELRDRKWFVEYQVGNRQLEVEVTDPRHAVYIYACKDSMVTIKGKVNNVSLDSCAKTGVVFEDVIASCEVVNCKGVQLQAAGVVPTILVEKTDGCQLYLGQRQVQDPNFQIVTAKCSEVNVVLAGDQDGKGGGDHAIPEQFISSYQGGKLVTVAAAHSGA